MSNSEWPYFAGLPYLEPFPRKRSRVTVEFILIFMQRRGVTKGFIFPPLRLMVVLSASPFFFLAQWYQGNAPLPSFYVLPSFVSPTSAVRLGNYSRCRVSKSGILSVTLAFPRQDPPCLQSITSTCLSFYPAPCFFFFLSAVFPTFRVCSPPLSPISPTSRLRALWISPSSAGFCFPFGCYIKASFNAVFPPFYTLKKRVPPFFFFPNSLALNLAHRC